MKHNDTTQKISSIIEQLEAMTELDIQESAKGWIEDAVCELQQAIDAMDEDEGQTH
jgi:hypothetical protein